MNLIELPVVDALLSPTDIACIFLNNQLSHFPFHSRKNVFKEKLSFSSIQGGQRMVSYALHQQSFVLEWSYWE